MLHNRGPYNLYFSTNMLSSRMTSLIIYIYLYLFIFIHHTHTNNEKVFVEFIVVCGFLRDLGIDRRVCMCTLYSLHSGEGKVWSYLNTVIILKRWYQWPCRVGNRYFIVIGLRPLAC
jgi:hypothetical protein